MSLIAALRARRPHLPAVLITAEDRASLATRALAAKVEVLAKPVSPHAIERFLAGVQPGD